MESLASVKHRGRVDGVMDQAGGGTIVGGNSLWIMASKPEVEPNHDCVKSLNHKVSLCTGANKQPNHQILRLYYSIAD